MLDINVPMLFKSIYVDIEASFWGSTVGEDTRLVYQVGLTVQEAAESLQVSATQETTNRGARVAPKVSQICKEKEASTRYRGRTQARQQLLLSWWRLEDGMESSGRWTDVQLSFCGKNMIFGKQNREIQILLRELETPDWKSIYFSWPGWGSS